MIRGRAGARIAGAPIVVQILVLLVAGLVTAQVVTVLVVLLAPPDPPQIYRMHEIATALAGGALETRDGHPLTRSVRRSPPGLPIAADRFEDRSRRELARLLGVPAEEVRLRMRRSPPFLLSQRNLLFGRFGGRPRVPDPPPPPPPEGGADGGAQTWEARIVDEAGPPPREPRLRFFEARALFGDFTASRRLASGDWVVVEPQPEGVLNEWQRRVLFWFGGCMLVLAPVAYLFARRITAPIGAFARAAERLGRDPSAPLMELRGPAEIGTAAQALNEMQVRLKRYVQDRTATMAAVSHDLRTPLARMRFKLEKAPPELKASLGADVSQMEAMVASVLAFIREGAEPRRRERIDLLSAVECAVDDAAAAGGQVEIESGDPVIVDADALGLQRLFANLIDNAVKYGRSAQVKVRAEGGEGVVEIADRGPGLPESELERVFQPFYRVDPSRSRDTGGIGLGLAVARSIARAHGGDVALARGEAGLTARVRLPLALV
jgi:signal transduction histidine kinase